MDPSTLERRQRDITYGKNTKDYSAYRDLVEKEKRLEIPEVYHRGILFLDPPPIFSNRFLQTSDMFSLGGGGLMGTGKKELILAFKY